MKYLGLDLGSVTCGVSRSETGFIAETVETIRFHPDDYDQALDRILSVIEREKPDIIVLGYPLLENGDAGERAQICEIFGKQLEKEKITGKLIHLCFTCDPYPTGYDSTPTREIIRLLKEHGNHVQILTKGDGKRDFDLLDGEDWYGVTIDGAGDRRETFRVLDLFSAHERGIKTWVSFEPVIDARKVLTTMSTVDFADRVKIGKLNYHRSDIDWAQFGHQAEEKCKALGLNYYIKESLRAEMEKAGSTHVE